MSNSRGVHQDPYLFQPGVLIKSKLPVVEITVGGLLHTCSSVVEITVRSLMHTCSSDGHF